MKMLQFDTPIPQYLKSETNGDGCKISGRIFARSKVYQVNKNNKRTTTCTHNLRNNMQC